MPREQSKCREWEKERRDRLNNCFQSLSKLLPSYDPSLTLSKIEILQRAATYIEQLLKRNNDLTSDEKKSSAEKEEINRLCDRIKKLLVRNEQLASLLNDAGIKIPAECGLVKNFSPKLPWSNRISKDQANILKKKLLQKENETPKNVKTQKKKNVCVKPKLKSPICASVVKPRKLKNGKRKPLCTDRKISVKVKQKRNKFVTPGVMTVVNNGSLTVLPSQAITLPYPQPCYVIANASFTSLKSRTVVTQTRSLTTPIVASSVQPSGLTSQAQSSLSALGPGTLILANGNIMPVLPASSSIFKPSPSIITQSTPILVNSNQSNNATLIVMPSNGTKTTKESDKKVATDAPTKGSKTLTAIQPKIMPVPLKKVAIPALGPRYFTATKSKSTDLKEKKATSKGAKKVSVVKKTVKNVTVNKDISKTNPDNAHIEEITVQSDKQILTEIEKENRCENDLRKRLRDNEEHPENAKRSKLDEVGPKDIQETSNYSIDSLCKDADKLAAGSNPNIVKEALNTYDKINNLETAATCVMEQKQIESNSNEIQANIYENVQTSDEITGNAETTLNSCTQVATDTNDNSSKDIHCITDNALQPPEERISDEIVMAPDNVSAPVSNPTTPPVTSCHSLSHSELLPHSELSNDIFATLQVPNGIGGSQNPDSTSPTAAFLLAFPLVQTYTGVKVSEVMDEENSDSQQDTPTLLQIGTMEPTKSIQSESLTPSLLNLDNFSFFSSKDMNSFYPSYDTNSTGLGNSSGNTQGNLAQQQQQQTKPVAETQSQMETPEKCKPDNSMNEVHRSVPIPTNKPQKFELPPKNQNALHQTPNIVPQIEKLQNPTNNNQPTNTNFSTSKPPPNISISNTNTYGSMMPIYQEKHHSNTYQLPQPINYCVCNTSTTQVKPAVAMNNSNCSKPNISQQTVQHKSMNLNVFPPISSFQENNPTSKLNESNPMHYGKKTQKPHEQRCAYTCSTTTSSTYSFSASQCNTFNPFTDFTPNFPTFSHSTHSSKACSEPLYTNSTNYNYSYQQTDATNNFSHSNAYPTHQNKTSSTKLAKNQFSTAYETNYAAPSVNYKYPESKTSTSSYYCPITNPVAKETSKAVSKSVASDNNLIRPPVNWMTTPDLRHQTPNSDYLVPPFGKDLDFCQNPIFPPNNFAVVTNQSYYNANTSVYSTPDMQSFTSDTRKPILETPFHVLPPNSFQRNDILQPDDNQYSWSPSKIPPLLDSQHNLGLVPSTLPTLIGDLALGINTLGDKKMNQDASSIKVDSSCTRNKDASGNKKAMKQAAPTYDNQSNFLSVSQLVEHGKPEIGASNASRTVSRRNSGSRSNKPATPRQKSRSSKINDQAKDLSDQQRHQQQQQQQQNVDMHTKNYNLQASNQRETNWNLGEGVSAKANKHYKSSSSNYSAEALIGHQGTSNVNLSAKQTYSSHNFHYPPPPPPTQSSKPLQMPSFMSDNIFLPTVDFQTQDNFSSHQQNQSYQTNSFTPSLQNSVYPSSSYISSAPTITSSYLPSGSLLPEIGNEFMNATPLQDNLFSHNNGNANTNAKYKVPQAVHKTSNRGNDNKANASCSVAGSNNNNKKNNKRKHSHVGDVSNANGIASAASGGGAGFVDLSFLTIPGSINSPILPDDFHSHANFLPPPPNPSQFFPCKNTLYPKQTADLLPPPPRHATVQHPETSPIGGNVGTSLTNFNLSTIFPEINKGPVSGLYSSSVRTKDYQLPKNDNLLGHSISQVPFNNKVPPPRTLSYNSNGIPSTSISFSHN